MSIDADEILSKLDLESKNLDISGMNIKGTLNLAEFTIESLDCSNNPIEIINLPQGLKYLNISSTKVYCINYIQSELETICSNSNSNSNPPITHMDFFEFNYNIILPSTLTHLDIMWCENRPLILPLTLTHLKLSAQFNQLIESFPPLLKELKFGNSFNQPIEILPQLLTHLKFGNSFNQPLAVLPSQLIRLEFGDSFNQPIEFLPPLLTHLKFGNSFNQPLGVLPPQLVKLEFGNSFNQPIELLPPQLTHLVFGDNFSQPIILPPALTDLTLGWAFNHKINLPPNLTNFEVSRPMYGYLDSDFLTPSSWIRINCVNLKKQDGSDGSDGSNELDNPTDPNNLHGLDEQEKKVPKVCNLGNSIIKSIYMIYYKHNNFESIGRMLKTNQVYEWRIKNIPSEVKKNAQCFTNYKYL